MSPDGRIEDGIFKERQMMADTKTKASYILDTSNMLTKDLRSELHKLFVEGKRFDNLMITVMSFGFKYGVPADADLMFDVRFLPNPFYIEELKHKTGDDKDVQDYVMQWEVSKQFNDKLLDMVHFLIPHYIQEGKNQLVIAIGCTGGKHRSVTFANALYQRIQSENYGLKVLHRDIKR